METTVTPVSMQTFIELLHFSLLFFIFLGALCVPETCPLSTTEAAITVQTEVQTSYLLPITLDVPETEPVYEGDDDSTTNSEHEDEDNDEDEGETLQENSGNES